MKEINLRYFNALILLFCLAPLFFSYCESQEEQTMEESFYSISSLCFYLNELLPDKKIDSIPNETTILFSDKDVASLWSKASDGTTFFPQICQARQYYYQAKNNNDTDSSEKLFAKAKYLINRVWQKLNAKHLKKSSSPLVDNDFIPDYYHAFTYPHLENNPLINPGMAAIIAPFLIPADHPIKHSLDEIFKLSRAIKNEKTFDEAGFQTLFVQNIHSYIRVARHDALPGYLLKVYLESEPNEMAKQGWFNLANRCQGAANVRQLINEQKMKYFTVPDKWLYIIPPIDATPTDASIDISHNNINGFQLVDEDQSIDEDLFVNEEQSFDEEQLLSKNQPVSDVRLIEEDQSNSQEQLMKTTQSDIKDLLSKRNQYLNKKQRNKKKDPPVYTNQPLLLVVTDMNLVSDSATEKAWKTKITPQHLDELYCVISHGFASSGLVRNVPYTKDGTFAFIDTEKPLKTPKYDKARHYFSKEMQDYWDQLVKNGGKSAKKKKKNKIDTNYRNFPFAHYRHK